MAVVHITLMEDHRDCPKSQKKMMIGGNECHLLPVRSDAQWQNVLWREQCPEMVGNMKNEAPGLSQVTKQWVYTGFVLFPFQEISAMRN